MAPAASTVGSYAETISTAHFLQGAAASGALSNKRLAATNRPPASPGDDPGGTNLFQGMTFALAPTSRASSSLKGAGQPGGTEGKDKGRPALMIARMRRKEVHRYAKLIQEITVRWHPHFPHAPVRVSYEDTETCADISGKRRPGRRIVKDGHFIERRTRHHPRPQHVVVRGNVTPRLRSR